MRPSIRLRTFGALVLALAVLGSAAPAGAHPNKLDRWTGSESHGWSDWDPADGPSGQAGSVRDLLDSALRYPAQAGSFSEKLGRLGWSLSSLHEYLLEAQHGGAGGHLAPSSKNVELVGKVQLTNVASGIADVAAFGRYAYLNAFSPECAGRPGAQGTGVHIVDISDPANPVKVNFLPSEPNSYQGEGVHVIAFEGKRVLVHNNETCDASQPVTSGFGVWDVTDAANPANLGTFGDTTPPVANQTFHTTHSVQAFTWEGRAYAVAQDNQDLKDVDIFDITPAIRGTGPATLVWEGGLEDWPEAHAPLANGDSVFHHDMQQQVIDGHNYLLLSYWDAGQILVNIDDPANPVYQADSDFPVPDSLMPEFDISEGNSHQSYWSADGKYVLSSDEDFSPTRTSCEIRSGSATGATPCGEFGFTPNLADSHPDGYEGSTIWGGSGCVEDGSRDALAPAADTGADIAVFSRGVCFFSDKIHTAEVKGYDIAVVGQSHGGTRNGMLPDGFICGGQGSPIDGTAPSVCIGHRAMHQLFDVAPSYTGPEFTDLPPINTLGHTFFAKGGVFDGWGYVRLHDGETLEEIDAYAVDEGIDADHQSGFGNLTVHEVKTDPRAGKNLAYFSYYDAGLRITRFGENGIQEVGHYIAEGGNDFWGVYPVLPGNNAKAKGKNQGNGRPLLLMSDRDSGLWIFRYTGKE